MTTIKRIIFDLDNTLIPWKKEYNKAIKETLTKFNLSYTAEEIDMVIDTYESKYDKYTVENFITHAKSFNIILNKEFILSWLESLKKMSIENKELKELLEYLSKKYELVILTNWFLESQKGRLENANILQYFKELYGGDNFIKPNPESFLTACGKNHPSSCLMIGDNLELDIKPALDLGLKAIHLSPDKTTPGITTIKDLKELKNIL